MQTIIKFRGAITVAAIILTLIAASSCTQTKRYGCPNHLSTPKIGF